MKAAQFGTTGIVLAGCWLLLAGACLAREPKRLRALLALSGLAFAAAAATMRHPLLPAALALLFALINALQLWLLIAGGRTPRFSAEEERMRAATLARMSRRQARLLLDRGMWIAGRAGEQLTHEGRPVENLIYLDEGEALVTSGGRPVATCAAGDFIGEMTVLDGTPSSASVTLATPARFWCVPAAALRRFLDESPELRAPLEHALAGDMRGKLRRANEKLAAG